MLRIITLYQERLIGGTRVRKDGTPIETVSGFYALIRTAEGWKFFALSDITIPAG